MRQTTERLPYAGSAPRSLVHRSGFTLIEVVVAMAILFIVLIPLMDAFARGVAGFKQAQLLTFAENLAEFQAEDLKALAPTVLRQMCEGTWTGVPPGVDASLTNYPAAAAATPPDPAAVARDVYPFEYDSGPTQTDFNIIGIDAIVKSNDPTTGDYSPAYHAGGASAPELPTGAQVLLGSNILVGSYEQTDNPDPARYYYLIKLQHEAYPLFTKEIRVVCYDVLTPAGTDPWDPNIPYSDHFLAEAYTNQSIMDGYIRDERAMYAYDIVIRYKMGSTSRVLYETRGVISSPYSS